MSEYRKRRPLDVENPEGYMESDLDYLKNNRALAVELLDEYEENKTRLEFLSALYAAGVDNWEGYEDAVDIAEGGF